MRLTAVFEALDKELAATDAFWRVGTVIWRDLGFTPIDLLYETEPACSR